MKARNLRSFAAATCLIIAAAAQGQQTDTYVPSGTPRAVVNKLHATLLKTLSDAAVVQRLAGGGADVITSRNPEECAAFMKTQLQFWVPIIKRVGITLG